MTTEVELLKILRKHISEKARAQGRKYSLPDIVFLSIVAILMGAKNPLEISKWMETNGKRKEVKRLMGVEFIRLPKKSRLYDLLGLVDTQELLNALHEWLSPYLGNFEKRVLAVDGKKIRGSGGKEKDAIHVLSAVLADSGLIIAHQRIDSKSNEIPAFRALIEQLDESFCYGFDALHTQKKRC